MFCLVILPPPPSDSFTVTHKHEQWRWNTAVRYSLHLSGRDHFLFILHRPPFMYRGLGHGCPIKRRGFDVRRTYLPPAGTPTMTTVPMTLTLTMTHNKALSHSVWPQSDDKKVTFDCPGMTMRLQHAIICKSWVCPAFQGALLTQRAFVGAIYIVCSGAFDVAL